MVKEIVGGHRQGLKPFTKNLRSASKFPTGSGEQETPEKSEKRESGGPRGKNKENQNGIWRGRNVP